MDNSILQINTLHPKLRAIALQAYHEAIAATPNGVHPVITQGYRTFAESDRLYNLGRTVVNPDGQSAAHPMGNRVSNAKAGQSWHDYGLAVDFVLLVNGQEDWTVNTNWMKVVAVFEKHGFNWGGNFPGSFKDYPHLEMKFGHTLSQLLALHDAGNFISGTQYVQI